jgi:hypothetical protein
LPVSSNEERFLPGTIFAGRYRVVNLLGRGGMGGVYRATDLVLQQTVALKFLPEFASHDQKARERFLNEVRAAREITHPNVCRVHDIGELYGHLYLSMEFVDGEDLASLLARIGGLASGRRWVDGRRGAVIRVRRWGDALDCSGRPRAHLPPLK